MALGKEPYKELYAADLTALRDLSVMAERVYIHLACGERSSACCVASCDPEHLRYSVRARRTAEVMDALAELEAAGWLVLDLPMKQAWLPVQARRTWTGSESSATGWRNDLSRFRLSVASRQALNFIDTAPIAPSKGQSSPRPLSNSISSSISNRIPAVAKATATLAAPDVTRLALPMEAEPQADEVDPFADQPDPWSNIKPTVIDEVDLDYRPEVKLTPEAQDRIDRLKAEQAQQTLTLTAPKQSKTLTSAQQDAIFAKKRMAATVDLWNELLGKTTCGPCSHKEVAKMATQLMSNLAKYVSSEPGRDGSALIGWANAKSEYHSGRSGKRTWTLQQWLTTEHLAQVFADYRNERGDERKIRYLPERTLRDWREAEEAREAWVNSQQGQVAA